ncbi:Sec-independent protein translocase subunit TatA [Nakamurella sp. A5-74]|uniref:Sec-independent protein translocase protein TatA n=1 Tax=Nakamurella sp. A5-74 TaxID=3158264 RepID=A0AAU8DJX1_9ACTN
MGGLSWWHWLIIIAAFILIFGARKLPDAARGVGRSLRILKSEVNAMHEDDEKREKKPSETDASASEPTPTAQLEPAAPVHQVAVQSVPAQSVPVQAVPVQPVPVQPVPVQPIPAQAAPAAVPVPRAAEQFSDPTRPTGS